MPSIASRSVLRGRLLDCIDAPELAPVTFILAPAGYGKSTLAHQWIAHRAPRGCGWYQIRPEHNALDIFLHHLWSTIDAAAGDSEPAPETLTIDLVLDRLRAETGPTLLVLDDYHLIENGYIHQALERLIRNLPSCVRLFILSRKVPDIPLARLRAYGYVRQITQEDLAFTFDEVKQVFAGSHVGDELLYRLTTKSDGWIAGLQLALMSLPLTGDDAPEQLDRLIASMSSSGLLDDYIIEEALAALPDRLRCFVLDTVLLDGLDPALCNAVVDITDSALLLEQLEANIVFVSRPGNGAASLTYHQLFAECVQRVRLRRYPRERTAAELQLRAAHWHTERGELEQAANYALAAEAWDQAKDLICQFLPESLPYINVWKALYWLRRLPESVLRTDTRLFLTYIHTLLSNGLTNEARPLIAAIAGGEDAELTSQQQGWLASHLAAVASVDGNRDEVLFQSYRALSLLPMDDTIVRLLAWSFIYREEALRGNRALAPHVLQHAAINRARHPRASVCWHFVLEPMIANDAAMQGDLRGAEQLIHHFNANIPAEFGSFVGKLSIRLLGIYLEQNRLDLANAEADAILQQMQHRPYGPWFPEALIAIANCNLANGNPERAKELFDQALQSSNELGGLYYVAMAEAAIASYWLRTGQFQLARHWVANTRPTPYLAREFGETEPRAVRLRFFLLEDRLTDARALANESLLQARSTGNVAAEIEFLVWSSVIARALNDLPSADDDLRQALELGAPGRFARIYASTGVELSGSIRALLPELSDEARCHARTLIEDRIDTEPPVGDASWLGAGLTQREREVLAELVQGKSNREIGEALYISERTVKKHLASLFHKTGASNRMALALWGRGTESERRSSVP